MEKRCSGICTLPQELVDIIIDENQNDKAALRACSLVSRSWTYTSQRHIYSQIRFSHNKRRYYYAQGHSQRDMEQFHTLICAYPHVATLVRAIEVSPHLDAQLLALILEKLIKLENVSLDLCGYHWDEISPYMQGTILATLRSPRIASLELREGSFPHCADFLALLGACGSHLKHLSLSNVSWDDLEIAPTAAFSSRLKLQLDSLALSLYEHSYFPLAQLLSSINVSRLRRLSALTAGSADLKKRAHIMKEILKQLNGGPLKHLVLNVCLGEPLSNLIDISQLCSIHMKLWWIRPDQHPRPENWLRWLTMSFRELAKHGVLEEVTFEIFYASNITVYTDEWAALDAALGGIRSLRKVNVKVDNYDCARARWKRSKEYSSTVGDGVKVILPTLAKHGVLSVEIAASFPN
ncbi:uncharacterized protein EV420DRAFT_142579 [Desarmillaria tabescens]|uniref:F-box domain-containing protein n=1 Tax=Armillaria tabescens TaxID=1929756 RepID=A0AA39NAJ0_ARMTA|nr:uncharacterized protein EV420DRAFT_142579 [Desarmillaria tabescens]KAK0462039.1 hypothetical protein EV420DRAFT_142579 [Desarmillaria tabescens]